MEEGAEARLARSPLLAGSGVGGDGARAGRRRIHPRRSSNLRGRRAVSLLPVNPKVLVGMQPDAATVHLVTFDLKPAANGSAILVQVVDD